MAPALPPPPSPSTHPGPWTLGIGALGVVFGDIGTSPLYALRECFNGPHGVEATHDNVLGILSLVFWALTIIVTFKYLVFIMRADNRGEGGILALMALVGKGRTGGGKAHWFLVLMGLFGAALLYGDGVITPAISVLSAVEGLEVATPALAHVVVPVTIAILVGLFLLQSRGTHRVGRIFGPVMIVWFASIALLGLGAIWRAPQVLWALSPHHAFTFFARHGVHGYFVLGGVFLSVTGGEALYADMGHFGRAPIRWMWFLVVLPSLFLNYLGQGAQLLTDAGDATQPFFRMAPGWAVYPLLVLSTLATVIASQALVSAAFSLTRQAVQLGYCPRLQIRHTSSREIGQIYVPAVNFALAVGCIALVLSFRSSTNLAAAYGIAVTCTMAITTVLFFFVVREQWRWPLWRSAGLCGLFLGVDAAFLGANAAKFMEGGWVPLLVGVTLYALMHTWKWGRDQLGARIQAGTMPMPLFLETVTSVPPARVPGTAVYMAGNAAGVPPSLLHNLKHNQVMHERVVILTLLTEEIPTVADEDRLEVESLSPDVWRLVAHYGFMEGPNVPELLAQAESRFGLSFPPMRTTFFLGRETLVVPGGRGLVSLRLRLFKWMDLNARSPTDYFHLPPNRVVELGAQIEL